MMTIKELLKENKTYNPLLNSSVKKAEEMLLPNEQLVFAIGANTSVIPINNNLKVDTMNIKNKKAGVIVLTNNRLFFCNSVIGSQTTKQILLKDITSIDDNTILGFGKIRICGITEMFVIDLKKKQIEELKLNINTAVGNLITNAQ